MTDRTKTENPFAQAAGRTEADLTAEPITGTATPILTPFQANPLLLNMSALKNAAFWAMAGFVIGVWLCKSHKL